MLLCEWHTLSSRWGGGGIGRQVVVVVNLVRSGRTRAVHSVINTPLRQRYQLAGVDSCRGVIANVVLVHNSIELWGEDPLTEFQGINQVVVGKGVIYFFNEVVFRELDPKDLAF